MISILFAPGTRFDFLKKAYSKIQKKKAALTLIFGLFIGGTAFAQEQPNHSGLEITDEQIDSIIQAYMVDLKHAESFNK